jgi:large subunit ribosomal protein L33
MAKKTEKRKIIGLVCEACGQRHYYTSKNTQNTPDKIEQNKYCPTIRKIAKHIETKKNLGINVTKKRKG